MTFRVLNVAVIGTFYEVFLTRVLLTSPIRLPYEYMSEVLDS